MTSDIEDYSCECKELQAVIDNSKDVEERVDARLKLSEAEPFWRKLAMRYREALQKHLAEIETATGGFVYKNSPNLKHAYDVLALTRKDLE